MTRSKIVGLFLAGLWCGLTTGIIAGVRFAEPWWYGELLRTRIQGFDEAFDRVERLGKSYEMESDYFQERLTALVEENQQLRKTIEESKDAKSDL